MKPVLFVLFAIDLVGSLAGMYLMRFGEFDRRFVSASSGVMLGIALFWIWPDLAQTAGTFQSVFFVVSSYAVLYAFDRYVYPICPCCTAEHAHYCHKSSFPGTPLLIAIFVHNLFDGFLAGATENLNLHSRSGVVIGLLAHKIPEAVLFGMMLRSASKDFRVGILNVLLTSAAILAGGLIQPLPQMLQSWTVITLLLTFACGSFLFLGVHTFVQQQRTMGPKSALAATLIGVVCTIVLEAGASVALR
jgi:zinc transporter ZupT